MHVLAFVDVDVNVVVHVLVDVVGFYSLRVRTNLPCPLGLKGVVVGQGDTYEAALADVRSAIQFHVETFGIETIESDPPLN